MKMKKLLKVTLSLLCVLAMTGCGSKENKNDTNSKKETTTQKQENKQETSKYFKNFNQEYSLGGSLYSINIQDDATIKHGVTVDYFIVSDNNNREFKIVVNSSLKDNQISLEDIKNVFELKREDALMDLYDYNTVTLNEKNEDKISLKKYKEVLYESGNLTLSVENNTPNYVVYRFLTVNEDGDKTIFELMVCSDDYEEKDLKNIAEELISQIHETE